MSLGEIEKDMTERYNDYMSKMEKDIIETESDRLAKNLEVTSVRISTIACQKYLVRQDYQVIKIT
jgi:hypothetical protein